MKGLFLLIFINTINTSKSKPDPYTFYHKNYTTYSASFHTYAYQQPIPFEVGPPPGRPPGDYSVQGNNQPPDFDVYSGQTPFARSSREESDSIVYPQQHTAKARSTFNISGRNCNFGLCEDAAAYPEDFIKNILRRTKAYDAFFNLVKPEIASKNFGVENVCNSVTNVTYPRVALNMQKKQRLIANIDQYKQGIKVETCSEKKGRCKFSDFWPSNYESFCEQKFTVTPLLALDDDMNPVVDTFQTPSCCVCMYKVA